MSFGIDQIIDKKKELFYGLPQEEMQRRAKVSGKLLDALATEQVLAEKQSAKNAMILAMQDDAKTVVEENEANLLGRTQQEVAEGVSGVLKNKKARMDQNLKRIAQMGIGGAKRPNMTAMAQGGIVGFSGEDGSFVQQPYGTNRGKRLMEIMQMDISPAEKRALIEQEGVMTSGPGMPVGKIAGATVARPEITPTIAPGTELSGLDVLSENLLEQRRIEQVGKDPTRFMPPDPLVSDSMKPPPPEKSEERKRLDAIDDVNKSPEGTKVFDSDRLKVSSKVQPKTLPMDTGTMLTDVIMPDLTKFVENPPEDVKTGDKKPELDKKEDDYNEWLERLLTVLSAPASGRGLGGGNVARAYLQYSQRIFDNKAKIREIEADELEAQAKADLNKLTQNELSYSRLVGRQSKLLEIIQKVREDATDQFKFKLLELNSILQDPKADPYEKEEAEVAMKTVQDAITDIVEDSTKRETALLKEVARRLNMLGFDESAGSRQISK